MDDASGYKRPSWDEYFMEVCRSIAKRATCDRGRSGCVIARDHQILATGYVGAPAGLPHCDEAGHQLKQMVHEDGSVTKHCVRSVHAEQNAICQAARRGCCLCIGDDFGDHDVEIGSGSSRQPADGERGQIGGGVKGNELVVAGSLSFLSSS
jgi:pyrimidine deaminase RibD-like protein